MVKKSSVYEQNKADDSIKYTGVRKRKWGKWVSEIRLPNSRERIWLGSYDSPEKAARAFDAAQFCLRGKSANYNFPENPPKIAGGRLMTPAEIQAAAQRFANLTSSSEVVVEGGSGGDDLTVREESEEHRTVDESLSYSPSISDGTTVQMDSFDISGVEMSFEEQLSLCNTLGSGNYVADFELFTGYDDFSAGEFFTTQQDNFSYSGEDDTYDASLYQDTYLWNF